MEFNHLTGVTDRQSVLFGFPVDVTEDERKCLIIEFLCHILSSTVIQDDYNIRG